MARFICSWCKAEDSSPHYPVVQSAMQPAWCIKCVDAMLKGDGERRKDMFTFDYQQPTSETFQDRDETPAAPAEHKERQRVIDRALETNRKYTDEQVTQYPLLREVALDYIRSYRGTNDFVQSIAVKLVDYGSLSNAQLRGALNVMVAEARAARYEFVKALETGERPIEGLKISDAGDVLYMDLRRKSDREIDAAGDAIPPAAEAANEVAPEIPNGTYTVLLDDTGTTYRTLRVQDCPPHFKVKPGTQLIKFLCGPDNTNDYTGFAFLACRKVSLWKTYRNARDLSAAADRLVADPMGAAVEYVKRSNRCFVCNQPLTTPTSIARGIGPICLRKIGELGFALNLMSDRDQAVEQVTLEQQTKPAREIARKGCQTCLGDGEVPDDDLAAECSAKGALYVPCPDCRPNAYDRFMRQAKAQAEIGELFPE